MKTKRDFLTGWAVVVVGIYLAGCGPSVKGLGEGGAALREVGEVVVESVPRAVVEDVVGTVRTKTRAVVEAKVSGRIEKLPVVLGQKVAGGDLLVEIDAREIRSRYERAQAGRDQARQDLERATVLVKKQVMSPQEFDAVEARFRVAEATVNEAEAMLGYARVTSPFDGVVSRKLAEVGDLAIPGRPLLEIEDRGALRFEADVPEALIGGVSAGQKVAVSLPSAGKVFEAEVVEVSPTADAVSRTFLIKLDLPVDAAIRAGQFGRAAIPVGEAESIRVPRQAVVRRGQMEVVFVNRDGEAVLRLVKTGKGVGDDVEILSGLSPGERVIVTDVALLEDGQRVEASR